MKTLKISCLGTHSPKPRHLAQPKVQMMNFLYKVIISLNFKFLAMAVSEFLHVEKVLNINEKKRAKIKFEKES